MDQILKYTYIYGSLLKICPYIYGSNIPIYTGQISKYTNIHRSNLKIYQYIYKHGLPEDTAGYVTFGYYLLN